MTLEYIRDTYGVPAYEGMKIVFTSENGEEIKGTIVRGSGGHLRVRLGNNRHLSNLHPTYNIVYLGPKNIVLWKSEFKIKYEDCK